MNLMNRTHFATLAGVSRQAVTNIMRTRLKAATVGDGRKAQIDSEHPVAIAYVDEKRLEEADGTLDKYRKGAIAKKKRTKANPPPAQSIDLPDESEGIQDLENLTIREVVLKHGSAAGFKAYVDALKSLADYKNKELLTRQRRGELIERETTAATLFSILDLAFRRLVTDTPEGMVQQIIARVQSGGDMLEPEVLELIKKPISKVLKDAKTEVIKKLKEVS